MPASVYRLAGRPHHTERQVTNVDSSPFDAPEQMSTIADVQSSPTVDSTPEQAANVESAEVSPSSNQYPTWDPAWTKSQLLEVAAQLGLSVSLVNTKAQIIDALTAATSA